MDGWVGGRGGGGVGGAAETQLVVGYLRGAYEALVEVRLHSMCVRLLGGRCCPSDMYCSRRPMDSAVDEFPAAADTRSVRAASTGQDERTTDGRTDGLWRMASRGTRKDV